MSAQYDVIEDSRGNPKLCEDCSGVLRDGEVTEESRKFNLHADCLEMAVEREAKAKDKN